MPECPGQRPAKALMIIRAPSSTAAMPDTRARTGRRASIERASVLLGQEPVGGSFEAFSRAYGVGHEGRDGHGANASGDG